MMFARTLVLAVGVWGVLFISAGRVDIPQFWVYGAVLWLSAGTIYTVLLRRSPELVAERMRPPSDRDRASRRISLPLALGHYVIAGLDAGRFHWSALDDAWKVVGIVFVAASMALVGWTLLSNPYASSAVRIQKERDHRVITKGPYAIVRHPMYLGVLLFCLGSGPALGSAWAGLLLLPVLAVFVRRTLLEDRMLHADLPGYADYAAKVRSRVVPGIF
jgi:protein-S-isoprenylcysteine O-methyltransferase Ste14